MTTRANSLFPRPDLHRLDKQPYGLRATTGSGPETNIGPTFNPAHNAGPRLKTVGQAMVFVACLSKDNADDEKRSSAPPRQSPPELSS